METEAGHKIHSLGLRLFEAQRSAMPQDDYRRASNKRDLLQSRFLNRELTLQEYLAKMAQLRFEGTVEFASFDEFSDNVRDLLQRPKTETERIINHEKGHFITAKEAGFKDLKYGMQFVKAPTGEGLQVPSCFVNFTIPSSMDDEVARRGLRKAIEIPGSDMSESDKNSLPTPEPTLA